ncbi:MAG TPA: hypothetical protein VIH85_08050 [Solirubrobacteraceae bacterium]
MSVLSRSVCRRAAGLVGVVVAFALIAVPAAWASGDTITGAAGVQFNGGIDASPTCTDSTSLSINWGDNSRADTTTGRYQSDQSIAATHTYAQPGTYTGHITFSASCGDPPDTFTANVGGAPQFTECPEVGVDTGCQFLIDVTPSGVAVLQDPNQGPYEGVEDALIGVKNDSSSPLSSIPISVANSVPFGFDGDGICDPQEETGGDPPVPLGCQEVGQPAGTLCDTSTITCAFPAAPGQPGADPDAFSGSTQDGYEGPATYFTNVSTDASSGVVNFSPALQPGQSTYFGLESPPSASAINVGSTPIGGGLSGTPTVTATSASFTAIVDPNGSATTAQFQYNLDPKYSSLVDAAQSTPTQSVGGDFANHVVTATVTGLVPNALYHVHLVASNKNGQTVGPDVTFKTSSGPTPGAPSLGHSVNISTVSGLILVKLHGVFVPLTELSQVPTNTEIDALKGTLKLITAAGGGGPAHDAKAKKGKTKTQTGTFGGAIFKVTQAHSGLATLAIVENAFKGAPSYTLCGAKKAGDASAAALSSKTLQLLKASAKGKFATKGKYSSATVRGTKWTIADKCNGTQVHDVTDSVSVTDFVLHKTIILHAGQTYLAKKP